MLIPRWAVDGLLAGELDWRVNGFSRRYPRYQISVIDCRQSEKAEKAGHRGGDRLLQIWKWREKVRY